MAYPSEHNGLCSNGVLRIVLLLVATFLVVYIVRPRLYSRESSSPQASCSCDCDCPEDFSSSLPLGGREKLLVFKDQIDVKKNEKAPQRDMSTPLLQDPDIHDEMRKDIIALLSEEIALQKRVSNDSLEHTRALVMDAKAASLHYQKEAEKCNAQTETCEEARERAEAELVEECKLSELWQKRAQELGWEENSKVDS